MSSHCPDPVVGRCRPLTGAEERGPLCTPSPSMTAMGGQDDAVVCSARLVPSARCNGSAPEPLCRATGHECAQFPLDPSARAAHLSFQTAASQTGRRGSPTAVLAQSPNSGQAWEAVPPLSCAGIRSQTAVRRQRTEQPRSNRTTNERFRRLEPLQWAWLDLNQRPHPYQGSRAKRCAVRPSPGRWQASGAK